jgi:hypothetical protein
MSHVPEIIHKSARATIDTKSSIKAHTYLFSKVSPAQFKAFQSKAGAPPPFHNSAFQQTPAMPCHRLKILPNIHISFVPHKASKHQHNHHRLPTPPYQEKLKLKLTPAMLPSVLKSQSRKRSRHLHLLILIDLTAQRLRLVTRDTLLPGHASEAKSGTAETADKLELFT